jgi:amino acid transporter
VLALLGVEVPLNMGVEIRNPRAVTRYLLWGSLVVVVAYLLATWGVMVTVPNAGTNITSVAAAVGVGLGSVAGKITALVLARSSRRGGWPTRWCSGRPRSSAGSGR